MVRKEVSWWFEVANKNLGRACTSFDNGDFEASVFWSQQAVEFCLKALILHIGSLPPKTHNLLELYSYVKNVLELDEAQLSELSPYYSISRYPDVYCGVPVVHRNTAERFLKFAEEVIKKAEEVLNI